jgi:hypothetical protein
MLRIYRNVNALGLPQNELEEFIQRLNEVYARCGMRFAGNKVEKIGGQKHKPSDSRREILGILR